ncbi:hypothetical protein [uncultured Desulfovibrio sp.]|uniref:hypothetical protein n=1 Tax=uncultured Desulfovibrio sp. TaxID=167968 RepID=UPI00265CCFD1|nr:hypothetical protein [uncultured Desulfovibrio sp.]
MTMIVAGIMAGHPEITMCCAWGLPPRTLRGCGVMREIAGSGPAFALCAEVFLQDPGVIFEMAYVFFYDEFEGYVSYHIEKYYKFLFLSMRPCGVYRFSALNIDK